MKKNFRKISLVAGFVTLVCFGANAQLTGPVGNVLSSSNYVRLGVTSQESGLEITNNSVISLSLFNAYGGNLNWGTTGIGFNLKRTPYVNSNNQWQGTWSTRNDGVSNGGSAIFGDVDGNLNFLNLPNVGNLNQSFEDVDMFKKRSMTLNKNGQLLIALKTDGTGYPTNIPADVKLAVNGRIYTTGIKVHVPNPNWPDYVFKKDYKLAPLSEVERFIAANSHLPNVPSEAEVKGNGIDMAEMDAVLLRKIEELTLYMIQLKKDNEELSRKVEALSDNQ